MSWTQEKFGKNLKSMIELSSLTGAIMVGLGDRYSGIFSNDQSLTNTVIESGKEVGEIFWQMPIGDHKREDLKGRDSD